MFFYVRRSRAPLERWGFCRPGLCDSHATCRLASHGADVVRVRAAGTRILSPAIPDLRLALAEDFPRDKRRSRARPHGRDGRSVGAGRGGGDNILFAPRRHPGIPNRQTPTCHPGACCRDPACNGSRKTTVSALVMRSVSRSRHASPAPVRPSLKSCACILITARLATRLLLNSTSMATTISSGTRPRTSRTRLIIASASPARFSRMSSPSNSSTTARTMARSGIQSSAWWRAACYS